jgi:hypothetical protein
MSGVVFLVLSPFVKRDYERFGIDLLQKNFDVHVFDMTGWFRPDFLKKNQPDIYSFKGYHAISGRTDFLALIEQLPLAHAVDFIDISSTSFFIRKKLRAKGISLTKVQNGLQPKAPEPAASSKVIRHLFTPSKWRKLLFSLHKAILPRAFFSSDYLLIGGLAGKELTAATYTRELIPNHSFDYDVYLGLKNAGNNEGRPFAVFIDQNYVYHPDMEFLGLKPFVTPSFYYSALEHFFADFESKTGMQVVIAAHPRSCYDQHPDIFKGRPMFQGKTAGLIRDSRFVLLHQSNSVSYAVLWNKPVLFLTTNEINNSFMTHSLNEFCRFFEKVPLNLDRYAAKELLQQIEEPVNEIIYRQYIDQFLRYPGSPDKYFWEIYADFLQGKKMGSAPLRQNNSSH